MNSKASTCLLLILACCPRADGQTAGNPQFLTFEQAQPVLRALAAKLPEGLRGPRPPTSEEWARWVQREDAAIRARLERGEEDTLTNLLRFGGIPD